MSSLKDNWETPRDLFDRCDAIWHFNLDAASDDGNALCERHFTKDDDALALFWGGAGSRVWLNPPYGRQVGAFVEKAYNESLLGAVVVCLLPARTDTAWWQDFVSHADEVVFLRGRVRFCVDGEQQGSAPFPSALVRFGGSLPKTAKEAR
jgi:site-specific DNA-methyltransferase (adenine-specific)